VVCVKNFSLTFNWGISGATLLKGSEKKFTQSAYRHPLGLFQ
jgi:hypothetical protein